MYESFFGLSERPFQTTPQLQGYFAAEQIENALNTIISCVERGAGPAMVIASTGTGKTTLVLKLQEHFAATTPVAVLSGTNCRSPRSLLQNALFAAGLPYVDMDEGQMRLSLTEFFKSRAETGNGTLLLMDDADALGTDLLEELLGFSSLTGQNGWCVPMVLIGSFRLEEALGSPRVASLNQRIAARCYIDSWSRTRQRKSFSPVPSAKSARLPVVFLASSINFATMPWLWQPRKNNDKSTSSVSMKPGQTCSGYRCRRTTWHRKRRAMAQRRRQVRQRPGIRS